jgi:hypothetical protein
MVQREGKNKTKMRRSYVGILDLSVEDERPSGVMGLQQLAGAICEPFPSTAKSITGETSSETTTSEFERRSTPEISCGDQHKAHQTYVPIWAPGPIVTVITPERPSVGPLGTLFYEFIMT